MLSPLDTQRMAFRVEALQRTSTRDWRGGDDLDFKNLLPGGHDHRALPDPATLRAMADKGESPSGSDWRLWVAVLSHMESMVHANDPRNQIRNMIHNMSRGLPPTGRR